MSFLLRNGEKYIYFVDNSFLFLFPTVKEFSKSVNNNSEVIAKSSAPRFSKHSVCHGFSWVHEDVKGSP